MAITFQLVEATPDRLMYLATQDGVISSPPVAGDGTGTIPNAGGVSPDLQTDALGVASAALPDFGVSGIPILALVDGNRNGYGPFPQPPGLPNPTDLFTPNNVGVNAFGVLLAVAFLDIRPRTGTIAWSVVSPGLGADTNPTIRVDSDVGTPATAYVELKLITSLDG